LVNDKTVANGEFKGVSFGGGGGFGGGFGGGGPGGGGRPGPNNVAANGRGGNARGGGGGGNLSIGSNPGTPVSNDYTVPNPFNGEVGAVTFAITSPNGEKP
jgi:hypothetical protein